MFHSAERETPVDVDNPTEHGSSPTRELYAWYYWQAVMEEWFWGRFKRDNTYV